MNPISAQSLNMASKWLEQTSLSQAIQLTNWVVPTVQTIHILAICVVASSALMIDLRLLGAFAASRKKRAAEFRPLIAQLRTACNGYHAAYLKTE